MDTLHWEWQQAALLGAETVRAESMRIRWRCLPSWDPNLSSPLGEDMKRVAIFFVAITICLVTVRQAQPQSTGQGKWSEKARLPEPRGEVAVATVNGKIYVLGGSARGRDDQPLNEEY